MEYEIKIRAWDTYDHKMLYRNIYDRNWYGTPKNDDAGCHCIRGIVPEDRHRLKLMLYTGLEDRNGTEIYKWDILKIIPSDSRYAPYNVLVEYNYGGFVLKRKNEEDPYVGFFYIHASAKYEVIGNKFENKELLEE